MFSNFFPRCHLWGMTEEQFWHSNPRIWKVWEEAHKQKINEINTLNWLNGMYTLNALSVALDNAFNGKKAKSEYMEKPIRLYEMTEEEKSAEQQKALEQAIAFFNGMEAKANR